MNQIDAALENLMTPEAREIYRRQEQEKAAREAKHIEQMRVELAAAMVLIGDAIRFPKVARVDLENTMRHIHRALSIAAVLDPE